MPVCDGLSAIKKIRAYETSGRLERTRVIALTGNARQAQLDVCRDAGFQHGIVTKVGILTHTVVESSSDVTYR